MAELKKVVHVMRRFVPEKWGGTESVVFNLARVFNLHGVESPVFCTDMLAESGPDSLEQVVIRRFRYLFPWVGLSMEAQHRLRLKGGSPLSLSLFFALLREKDVSLIHTHVQHRLGGMARTAARIKKIPYVVSIHGGYFTLPEEQAAKMTEPFHGRLEWGKVFGWIFGSRRVLEDAAAILCVGKNEYDECRKRFPADKVFYLPNGVDVYRFTSSDGDAFRRAYHFDGREKLVVCVSRIDYQKNQLGLVQAFASFFKTHPDHRLVLIGAVTVDEYLADIVREIDRLKLGHAVRIIPGLRPDDPLLPAAYRAADMFVLPSKHEPFGIAVLEAWAAGTPVIACAVGGLPGFCTDREDALLVEPDDEAGLAEAMTVLAEDAHLGSRLAEKAARKVADCYTWSMAAQQLRDIYLRILDINKLAVRQGFNQNDTLTLNERKAEEMPHREVKEKIGELKGELRETPKETGLLEEILEQAREGIERYTPEAVQDLVETLHREADEFEVEHPRITALINQVTTALSNLGI